MSTDETRSVPNPARRTGIWLLCALVALGSTSPPHAATAEAGTDENTFIEQPRRLIYEGTRSGEGYFSADGRSMVFQSERLPDNPFYQIYHLVADLWTMNPDGTDPRRLTDFEAMSWAPYPHPSGEYVFFASNKLGFDNFELYLVDAAGAKEPVRVTFTDGFDGLPAPSPGGRRLAWTSNRHGERGGQIYLADWNHEAALRAVGASPARVPAGAESADAPRTRLEDHVGRLAGPELEGRLTGSVGERLAADYIAGQLAGIGAEPLPGREDMQIEFEFTAGARDVGSSVMIESAGGARTFASADSVRALGFSESGQAAGAVVFAGYGIRVPDSADFGYDSYATLDVENKIVVVLRYVPEDTEGDVRVTLNRYSGLRYKALTAREAGAAGLLVVTGPRSPNGGRTIPMRFDNAAAGSGIPVASIDGQVAQMLFAGTGRTLEHIQHGFDDGNPHAAGFDLPDVRVTLDTALERERRTGRNVVAALPGAGSPDAPWVVLGAHYDHLGHGHGGNSLAREHETGQVHPGGDDNASGVAAVLEAAAALARTEHRRPVALAFWSGDELGLLGSSRFLDARTIPAGRIAAYINLDMVGRVRENRLHVQGVGSSPDWTGLIEAANVPVGFDLALQTDPYLPTDSATFYNAGIPTTNLFSGAHEDYHRPADTPDKIEYDREPVACPTNTRRHPMFIAMNRFRIALGREADFERVWRERESFLEEAPGFRSFALLKGPVSDDHALYASHTIWEAREAFVAWTESDLFRKAHGQRSAPKGTYLGHPQLETFEAVLLTENG